MFILVVFRCLSLYRSGIDPSIVQVYPCVVQVFVLVLFKCISLHCSGVYSYIVQVFIIVLFRCLSNFVHDRGLEKESLPLGFTFSFPLEQQGLAQAILVTWTKGFSCEGVEGTDVVDHLQNALARRGDVKIEVCAILNDTTGCLMRYILSICINKNGYLRGRVL